MFSIMTCMMMEGIWMVPLAVSLMFATTAYGENCTLVNSEVNCHHVLASVYEADIKAEINYCRHPVDVTFHVKVRNESWSWQHTFVNLGETQPLKGLDDFRNPQLYVQLEQEGSDVLHIMAFFVVDDEPMDNFLDASIVINDSNLQDLCTKPGSMDKNIPLVLFILLLVFIAAGLGMILWYRRWETCKPSSELLSDMEAPAHARPYHEEGLTIPYTDNPNGVPHSTIIKNSIYKDNVLSEGGAAGGIPKDTLENLQRKKKKKSKKRKEYPERRSSVHEKIEELDEEVEEKDLQSTGAICPPDVKRKQSKEMVDCMSYSAANGAAGFEQTRY